MGFRDARDGCRIVLGLVLAIGMGGCPLPEDPQLDPDASVTGDDAAVLLSPDAPRPGDAGPAPFCADGCIIDGACFRDGAANPANPCEICDFSASAVAFSPNDGVSCDDDAFCTVDDVCSGRVCVGGAPRVCDDAIACTAASTCNETSNLCEAGPSTCASGASCDAATGACVTECSGCTVDGTCYPDGELNPSNRCEVCTVALSTTAWSANDGAYCDDGEFCTVRDTCSAGVCGGGPRDCNNGVACDGTEVCLEDANICIAGASTCTVGSVCERALDTCMPLCAGCDIAGTCYDPGSRNPANACEICDVSRSREMWSANDGASCDDGSYCTDGDVCAAGICAGSARDCDDGVACNGAEICDEDAKTCAPGTATCGAGEMCDLAGGSCVSTCSGCAIDGVCFEADLRNPLNPCEICDVSRSRSAWSTNDGAICEDGDFCTVGDTCSARLCQSGSARSCDDGVACNGVETCDELDNSCAAGTTTCTGGRMCDPVADACLGCSGGCEVDSACFPEGAQNPLNPCEICAPSTSPSAWSANDGAVCNDGASCTDHDVCSAGVCAGAPVVCEDGVACNGVEVCDPTSGACVAGVETCVPGRACDVATDTCVSTCAGCEIDGVCFAEGDGNPLNDCEICRVSNSRSAWTANDGASCDDGSDCTHTDECWAGVCAGRAVNCSDGIVCNGMETCDESVGACVEGAGTCDPFEVCDVPTDTCILTCPDCEIGGVCFSDGDTNPLNDCEVCDSAASVTSWSGNDGVSCDDGSDCTHTDQCSGGVCAGTAVECSDGVACNGLETCDDSVGACVEGTTTCDPFEVCDVPTDTCILTCPDCQIDGVCYPAGDPNPLNGCEVCSLSNPTAWTPANGVTCDDGLDCTSDDVCMASVCAGAPIDCADGVSCNGDEWCDESVGACVAGAPTCGAGEVCDVAADMCVPE